AADQGRNGGAAQGIGREVRRPARDTRRFVSGRGSHVPPGSGAAVADAFRHGARGEGTRDAPSRSAHADGADDRHRSAPDAGAAGADGAVPKTTERPAAATDPVTAPRFSAATLSFLRRLKRNNRREWFNAHRDEYEAHVRAPMIAVIERLAIDFR